MQQRPHGPALLRRPPGGGIGALPDDADEPYGIAVPRLCSPGQLRTASGSQACTVALEKTAVAAKALGDTVRPVALDLSDEGSIQAAADQVRAAGRLGHLVSVAAERASGPVASLERRALLAAFDAKVLGPILLAKHFAPMIAEE